jgi:hypothetical protein
VGCEDLRDDDLETSLNLRRKPTATWLLELFMIYKHRAISASFVYMNDGISM